MVVETVFYSFLLIENKFYLNLDTFDRHFRYILSDSDQNTLYLRTSTVPAIFLPICLKKIDNIISDFKI